MKANLIIVVNSIMIALLGPLVLALGVLNKQPAWGTLGMVVAVVVGAKLVMELDKVLAMQNRGVRMYRGKL